VERSCELPPSLKKLEQTTSINYSKQRSIPRLLSMINGSLHILPEVRHLPDSFLPCVLSGYLCHIKGLYSPMPNHWTPYILDISSAQMGCDWCWRRWPGDFQGLRQFNHGSRLYSTFAFGSCVVVVISAMNSSVYGSYYAFAKQSRQRQSAR
jgi:hypothetical protein